MSVAQIIGFILVLLLMGLATIGSLLPVIPGAPLILLLAVAHRLYFGTAGAANWVLAVLAGLAVLSLLLDYLAGVLGAKKMGATWRGMTGALLGGAAGLFIGPFGLLLGPFVGATVFELVGGRDFQESSRAGAGALLGLVAGALGKLACCTAMVAFFAVNVLSH